MIGFCNDIVQGFLQLIIFLSCEAKNIIRNKTKQKQINKRKIIDQQERNKIKQNKKVIKYLQINIKNNNYILYNIYIYIYFNIKLLVYKKQVIN